MLEIFLRDEAGAITIDWVTLTSAIIIAAMAVIYALFEFGWTPVTNRINMQIETGSAELCNGNVNDCYVISK